LAARLPAVYLCALFLLAAGCLLYRPIMAGDTDLWYHLNAGRFILTRHALPHDSFFSFLAPPRVYDDYYWLFQVTAFTIYSWGGYLGLILLRTGVFGAALLVIGRYLFGAEYRAPSFYGCLIFSLYALFLIPRYMLVRPHIISYLCIPLFICVLESRGKWLAALPPLAALWGNLHGVECPVVCLILGSYVAEQFLRPRPDRQRFLAWAGLAMVAVFCTPLGMRIFKLAAIPMDYNQVIVSEGHVPRLSDLTSLRIVGGMPALDSVFNLLLAVAGLCAIASVARRKPRLSHLLLLAGGLCLLTRANRFRYECALLMLPLIKENPPFEREAAGRLFPGPVLAALLAALMAMPALVLKESFVRRPRYPFSSRGLPQGVVSFLRHVDGGEPGRAARVWNIPSPGGYLEWMLYPRYLIAADMQTPFLFDDKDLYLTSESFFDCKLLGLAIRRYAPDFIMAPLEQTGFPKIIGPFTDYIPVFFDDTAVLYANRKRRPDIVRTYALAEDPFHVSRRFPAPDKALRDKPLPPYVSRMLAIDPAGLNTHWRAAEFCARQGNFQEELSHAEAIIRNYPENHFGYLVKGHALRGLGRFAEALAALRLASARSAQAADEGDICREMAAVYQARHQFAEAFQLLRQIDRHMPPEDWLSDATASEDVSGAGKGAPKSSASR
jgi:tetratricopeptide (TPR) repeat protein